MKGMKTGGRKKGTTNKVTRNLRELLMNICEETFDEYLQAFHMIDEPKEKTKCWLGMLSFCLAKPSQVDLNVTADKKTYADDMAELLREKE